MLVDAHELAGSDAVDADICIIGCGPSGLTLARELDGRSRRVVVLERGGLPGAPLGLDRPAADIRSSDFEAPPEVPPRFGGGANEWIVRLPWARRGVRMVPLSPLDLEARPWVPDSGWPIGWGELARHFDRAKAHLGLPSIDFDVSEWEGPDRGRLPLEAHGFTTAMEMFPRAAVLTEQSLREMRDSSDVTVYLNAPVGELRSEDGNVAAAVVDAGEGRRPEIRATTFVLACGGIENPRQLLIADGGRGLGNEHDVVGRYYMDHLRFVVGALVPSSPSAFAGAGLYDIRSVGSTVSMGKLVPTEDLMRQESLLNSAAMLLPKLPASLQEAMGRVGGAVRSAASAHRPDSWPSGGDLAAVGRFLASTVPEMSVRQRRFPPRTDAGWSTTSGTARRYEHFMVELQVEQAPVRENRVQLGSGRDEHGRATAELIWNWSELELRSARDTQRLLGEAVRDAGIGRLEIADLGERPELTTPGGAFHPTGGTRMHRDPGRGVVDENCRVHGVRNLYVAGSSVFPAAGYANPTFTMIALAIRLADHLRHVTKR